jgi:hypothetical protein
MDLLEEVTVKVHDGYFVDLFVRASNTSAISMYNKARGPSRGAWGLLSTCKRACWVLAPSPLRPTRHAARREGHAGSC